MRQWLRSHLTYANVMSTLAVFLVLGGGTALGAYVVSSNSQIGPGTVSGAHAADRQARQRHRRVDQRWGHRGQLAEGG